MIGQLLVFSALGLFLIFLGYLVKDRKQYNLIAGYNSMSAAEKAKVDIAGLASLTKQVFTAMGLFIIAAGIINFFVSPGNLIPAIAGISILTGTLFLVLKSKRFIQK